MCIRVRVTQNIGVLINKKGLSGVVVSNLGGESDTTQKNTQKQLFNNSFLSFQLIRIGA